MRKYYEPTQDASIYQEYSWKNTGLDEILEVGKDERGIYAIRSLIQFDITTISQSIVDGDINPGAEYELRLYLARADWLRLNQQVDLHPVSESWAEGSGYFYQNTNIPYETKRTPTPSPQGGFSADDGATWKLRESASYWSGNASGSSYLANSASAYTTVPIQDMTVDVTSIMQDWISGSYPNYGAVLKFPDADEDLNGNAGAIKFFSRNTHTIYCPQLVAKWNDQTYTTGSLTVPSDYYSALVRVKDLRPSYKLGETARLNLYVRDRYVIRTFDEQWTATSGNKLLPQTTYFSIVDIQSNTVVVPFDDSTRISCDGTTSYITFDIAGMYPGRYYKIVLKSVVNGNDIVYDNNDYFKVLPV